ncbi:MAG: methyltransferase [Nitrospinota bacterium]
MTLKGVQYILKDIIHDWDEGATVGILKNCRRAMPKNGKLLLVERVIPPGNDPSPGKLIDIVMLVITGGFERTEAEYGALLNAAGFKLTKVVATQSEMSVIEGEPV